MKVKFVCRSNVTKNVIEEGSPKPWDGEHPTLEKMAKDFFDSMVKSYADLARKADPPLKNPLVGFPSPLPFSLDDDGIMNITCRGKVTFFDDGKKQVDETVKEMKDKKDKKDKKEEEPLVLDFFVPPVNKHHDDVEDEEEEISSEEEEDEDDDSDVEQFDYEDEDDYDEENEYEDEDGNVKRISLRASQRAAQQLRRQRKKNKRSRGRSWLVDDDDGYGRKKKKEKAWYEY